MTPELLDAYHELPSAAADSDARVIVLTGQARFSAG